MVNLGAIARLVNVMREFNPEVARQAVTELWELQQAVNRIDANTARILQILEIQAGAQSQSATANGTLAVSQLPAEWHKPEAAE